MKYAFEKIGRKIVSIHSFEDEDVIPENLIGFPETHLNHILGEIEENVRLDAVNQNKIDANLK